MQPLQFTLDGDELVIRNENFFRSADAYELHWSLLTDGHVTETGTFWPSAGGAATGNARRHSGDGKRRGAYI